MRTGCIRAAIYPPGPPGWSLPDASAPDSTYDEWVMRHRLTLLTWGDSVRRARMDAAAQRLGVRHTIMRQIAANYRLTNHTVQHATEWGDVFWLRQDLFRQGEWFDDPPGYEWHRDYIEELPVRLGDAYRSAYGAGIAEPPMLLFDTAAFSTYTLAERARMTAALLTCCAESPVPVLLQWSWQIPPVEIASWPRRANVIGVYYQRVDVGAPWEEEGRLKAEQLAALWPRGLPLIIEVRGNPVGGFVETWCDWFRRLPGRGDTLLVIRDTTNTEVGWSAPFGLNERKQTGLRIYRMGGGR